MAHKEQIEFCTYVMNKFPDMFRNKKVLDCGSFDINGNNRSLFTNCDYTGIDIMEGNNVDKVIPIHEHRGSYDFIISTEVLEHDKYWKLSLINMVSMLNKGGMLLVTCATTGRPEHGTTKTNPKDSPLTTDYYRNLTEKDFRSVLELSIFEEYSFSVNKEHKDLQFYGF